MLCLLCCYCLMFDVLDPTSAHPIVIFGEVICLDISSICTIDLYRICVEHG